MLTNISEELANIVSAAAPSVVQVRTRHRGASGLVYAPDFVLTTGRSVGRDEQPRVRRFDGTILDAELSGWDPATRLVLLKVPGLEGTELKRAPLPRIGELAIALARSFSNVPTATLGLVSIIGGPLRTSARRSIEQVIRTSAPMHDGFGGGALLNAGGHLIGITTAASIRGLGVVIPAEIAWASAQALVASAGRPRGYLGIAAQPVRVPVNQRGENGPAEALLIVDVKINSPAADAGLLVGDLLVALDGTPLATPEDLLDLLVGERVGRPLTVRLIRGGTPAEVTVTAAERR